MSDNINISEYSQSFKAPNRIEITFKAPDRIEITEKIIYRYLFPNGKNYIGLTTQPKNARKNGHNCALNKGDTKYIYNAMRKYGIKNIIYEVLDTAETNEELCEKEIAYIYFYNSYYKNGKGYNMTYGGEGINGYKFTEKQKQNCREAQKRRKEEHPEIFKKMSNTMKQRALDNPNIGIQHSIYMKQLYHNNPSKKDDMSKLKLQQYKDNPDMEKQQSELKLMWYEDKYGFEERKKISETSLTQWQDPEKRKKIIDEKRKRFSKPFNVYKNGILINSFDYVPDCAVKMFGKSNNSNITAVLKGKRKTHKGYVFKYK
jgi:hypothetical protein